MDTYSAELLVRGYEAADRSKVFEAAEFLGCTVVIAKPNEIQLDIDRKWADKKSKEKSFNFFETEFVVGKSFKSFCQEVSIMKVVGWRSRGGNTHLVFTLTQEYSAFERIVFQSVLGSDPAREILNWKRVVDGDPNPIALFKPRTGD